MPQTVSVIVPSYNHSPFIRHSLDSIFKQKVEQKVEINKIIVIDDGSKDDSVRVIEQSLNNCPFDCELIARENKGLSATLNEGLAKTAGEYFAYLGSDDVWLPDFLANRLQTLDSRPDAVLAFGHSYLINEHQQITDCTKNWTNYADGNMLPLLLQGIIPLSPGIVYRRTALEKYGWNENSILEDYELYLKLSKEGEFAFDENILCAWRQHGSNVSRDFSRMLHEWIEAQNRVAEHLGIGADELKRIQSELKFNAATDLIRHGKKKEAASLMLENIKFVRSPSKLGKILLRLIIPTRLFQWNRARKFNNSIKEYGKLEI
jgi:alpha-1,3-rhamnosyltransferase